MSICSDSIFAVLFVFFLLLLLLLPVFSVSVPRARLLPPGGLLGDEILGRVGGAQIITPRGPGVALWGPGPGSYKARTVPGFSDLIDLFGLLRRSYEVPSVSARTSTAFSKLEH